MSLSVVALGMRLEARGFDILYAPGREHPHAALVLLQCRSCGRPFPFTVREPLGVIDEVTDGHRIECRARNVHA